MIARAIAAAMMVVALASCGAPVLRPRTIASLAARGALRCRVVDVEPIDGWSFRASSACGETVFLRCSGVLHVDCHAHATAAEVSGVFHPGDAPGHSPL